MEEMVSLANRIIALMRLKLGWDDVLNVFDVILTDFVNLIRDWQLAPNDITILKMGGFLIKFPSISKELIFQ